MAKVAAMLRAVNVGGRRLTMDEFKAALVELGHAAPKTVVATGNAVFEAKAADAGLEAALEAGLTAKLGGTTEVFCRDGEQLAAIMAGNPYPQMAKDDPAHLLVMFLKDDPAAALVEALRDKVVGREAIAVGPACLYVTYPDNIGTSKLTGAVIERAVKLRGTARNWNTVTKLAALTA